MDTEDEGTDQAGGDLSGLVSLWDLRGSRLVLAGQAEYSLGGG